MVQRFGALLLLLLLGFPLACVSVNRVSGDAAATGTGGATGADGGTAGNRTDGAPSERVIGTAPLGDTACATQTQQAQKLPLDMYILMDSSASMEDPTTAGPTKWEAVRSAVIAFLNDPQSAGLGVGLQYFPLIHAGVPDECKTNADCGQWGPCVEPKACSGGTAIRLCTTAATCGIGQTCDLLGICSVSLDVCSPAGPGLVCPGAEGECLPFFPYCDQRDVCESEPYATPAVPIAALPAAAPALIASLNGHMTDGFTPTAGALSGGIAHAQARARATPGRRVVVVLATDGLPSECMPADIAGVSALAAAGRAGTPSVSTFVIGVFGVIEMAQARSNLDRLALAGGTQKAFLINTGQNVTQAFQAALNEVRTSALSCEYRLPDPGAGDGGQLDYFRVNVQFTPGTGPAVTIGNVPDRARCHPTLGGWFYDVDPSSGTAPRTISVCDSTCAQFRNDPAGKAEILLGCKTEVIVL